ncbi:divergent PAP2 family protein [Oxobacter pfennigii]|uniref:Divergent PAP2 family protein n=1 Tax=Oxobacter pfennigii TaxID=36849 RepID=A0A0P8WQT6_9CLOT|nr:divergent PAP2 family protein [Oxobacter pfennigii]KPU44908.1 divergent PAP2 family protein [Oxobacter pfennigii]
MATLGKILSNKILLTSIAGWSVAQILKVLFVYASCKKIDFTRLVGSGGMPSSHSAFVVALTVSVGKVCGFDSSDFAISAVISFVVMYDAAGVRRAAGKQARVLNTIINDKLLAGKFPEEELKELLGHTPIEVIAGAFVGLFTAVLL